MKARTTRLTYSDEKGPRKPPWPTLPPPIPAQHPAPLPVTICITTAPPNGKVNKKITAGGVHVMGVEHLPAGGVESVGEETWLLPWVWVGEMGG